MTNADEVVENKCQGWVIVNGEEIKCQWGKEHLGCHSGYGEMGKVKWACLSGVLVPHLTKGCMCGSGYASDCEVHNPKPLEEMEGI